MRTCPSEFIDILLSLNGEDSYRLRCWSDAFGGFLPQPPYFSGGQRRGFTFRLSGDRSFDETILERAQIQRQALYPRPETPRLYGSRQVKFTRQREKRVKK